MQKVLDKYDVSEFFAYHQSQREEKVIEFGWIPVDSIPTNQSIVVSRKDSGSNNATLLRDYEIYFRRLTSLTPNEFIEKWEPSPRELEIYWKDTYPEAVEDQHLFIKNIAYLIRDGSSFNMFGASFEVFNVEIENEEGDEE